MGEPDADVEALLDAFVEQLRPGSHAAMASPQTSFDVSVADLRSAAAALLEDYVVLLAKGRGVSGSPPGPPLVPEA